MGTTEQTWSDYWSKEGLGGEVFITQGKEKHPGLADFWQAIFMLEKEPLKVLDIASGAGSIYAELPDEPSHSLYACDYSEQALKLLRERVPGAQTEVCGAESLPYEDAEFDLVVSQFGIEYAGEDAFAEAARVLAPGGKLRFLCHVEGGFIDQRTQAQLACVHAALESEFTARATTLTRALFVGGEDNLKRAGAAFRQSAEALEAAIQRHPQGIHAHLYQGFKQLYENHRKYAVEDILKWLTDMKAEIDTSNERLSHMRQAAMSRDDVLRVTELLTEAGLEVAKRQTLQFPGHDQPIAWVIAAGRAVESD